MNMFFDDEDNEDHLEQDSNHVIDLINQGLLDEAEKSARKLLIDYPEVSDGFDRLAMIYEKRGDFKKAVEMYQRVIDFVNLNPQNYREDLECVLDSLKEKIKALS